MRRNEKEFGRKQEEIEWKRKGRQLKERSEKRRKGRKRKIIDGKRRKGKTAKEEWKSKERIEM